MLLDLMSAIIDCIVMMLLVALGAGMTLFWWM